MEELKEIISGLKKYFTYVIRHKYFVGVACWKMGLYWQGLIHDWSKFLPSEFWWYMKRFSLQDKSVQAQFNVARLKHIHRNPHHRQHWIRYNDDGTIQVMEMPKKYAKEMLCDWWGVGRAFAKTEREKDRYKYARWSEVHNWYHKNKEKMKLHEATRNYIEGFLEKEKKLDHINACANGWYPFFGDCYDILESDLSSSTSDDKRTN